MCSNEIIDGKVVTFKDKPFHEACHTCKMCSKKIEGPCVFAQGSPYHSACFVCGVCQRKFTKELPFLMFEENPYCEPHYHEKAGSMCYGCKQPITSGDICRVEDKAFHPEHLKCCVCLRQIPMEEDCFARNGLPMCSACNM